MSICPWDAEQILTSMQVSLSLLRLASRQVRLLTSRPEQCRYSAWLVQQRGAMKDGMIQGWQNQRPHMKDVVNKQRQHSYSPKVNVCLTALRNEALRERPSLKLFASRQAQRACILFPRIMVRYPFVVVSFYSWQRALRLHHHLLPLPVHALPPHLWCTPGAEPPETLPAVTCKLQFTSGSHLLVRWSHPVPC